MALEKLILYLDTSSSQGQMALLSSEYKILNQISWGKEERHNEKILSVYRSWKKSRSSFSLDRIYCTKGPGSFTGLRVAAAFVKALSFSYEAPILGLSSFAPYAFFFKDQIKKNFGEGHFEVFIPSVAGKHFRSEFKLENQRLVSENLDLQGAKLFCQEMRNKIFMRFGPSSDPKYLELQSYSIAKLDQFIENIESYSWTDFSPVSYLDFYPLYLRKSEAEEKFRYVEKKKI